jgi:hypothetical protein
LAYYVLAAINYYQWTLVDVPLTTPIDRGSSVDPGTPPVPLANRFQNGIRVQRQLWLKMDDANRVAMIIHEAFSSFLKTDWQLSGPDQEQQRSDKVRTLVRQAFLNLSVNSYQFTPLMESWLSIPDVTHRATCGHTAPRIEISFQQVVVAPLVLENAQGPEDRQALWDYFCGLKNRQVTVRMYREPFVLVEVPYRTNSEGLIYEQTALKFEAVPGASWTSQNLSWLTPENCSYKLAAEAYNWFTYKPETLQANPAISCLMK